jgi:hypothetical protein
LGAGAGGIEPLPYELVMFSWNTAAGVVAVNMTGGKGFPFVSYSAEKLK